MKKVISILIVAVFCFSMNSYVQASTITKDSFKQVKPIVKGQKSLFKNSRNFSVSQANSTITEEDFIYVSPYSYVASLLDSYYTSQDVYYLNTEEYSSDKMAVNVEIDSSATYEKDSNVDIFFLKSNNGEIEFEGATYFNTEGSSSGSSELSSIMPKKEFSDQPYLYIALGIYDDGEDSYSDATFFKVDNPFYEGNQASSIITPPTVNEVSDKDKVVKGTAPSNTSIYVGNDKELLGIGAVGGNQTNFSINIPAQKAGTKLYIIAQDNVTGEYSEATVITVVDKTPPSLNVATLDDNDKAISGNAEKGAKVYAKVGTKQISATVTVGSNGKYTVAIPVQKAGAKVTIYAVDQAKNQTTKTITVLDKTPPPLTLSNNKIQTTSTAITGKSEPGVTIYVTSGKKTWTTVVSSTGKFSINISKQKKGTTLSIYAKDKAGNTSGRINIKVK